jgi:dCTP deaminase
MILNDGAIAAYIEQDHIGVYPEPEPEQVQPASLDVRLNQTVELEPGDAPQPWSLEYFNFPDDIAGLVTGRSSVGRKRVIVHKTAGWIDPGFEGQLQFEMKNLGDEAQTFEVGERIAQIVFFPLIAPAKQPYDGQFQGQEAGDLS